LLIFKRAALATEEKALFSLVATAAKTATMMIHDDRGLNNKEMLSALIQSHHQIQDKLIHQVTWLDQGTVHF
jgi:hypothetical protein